MKDKYTEAEQCIIATLSIALIVFLIFGLIERCVENSIEESTTVALYNAPPPNIEVFSTEVGPVVVEPTTIPEVKTGIVSINEVGIAAMLNEMPDMDIGICSWADIILTEDEMDLLRTTVYCEAGNQDLDTQVMVALTILNRLNSGYADDLRGVIYQKGAYAVTKWSNFEGRGWTEQVTKAVDIALSENEHPSNMYYFRTDYYHSFATKYIKSGDLYFSIERK